MTDPGIGTTELAARLAGISALVLDVDGVLTDGAILLDDRGSELKRFHVRDGAAIALWHRAGLRSALLSGRRAASVDRRAEELKIGRVLQGIDDKAPAFRALLAGWGVPASQACYMGDDLADLAPMRLAGLAACPADAAPEVLRASQLVADRPGGAGAVRSVVEAILKARGLWDGLVATFDPPA